MDKYDHCKQNPHYCGIYMMYLECPATCCPNCDCSKFAGKPFGKIIGQLLQTNTYGFRKFGLENFVLSN